MEVLKKNTTLTLGLGALAATAVAALGAYLFRKLTEVKLSPFLSECLEDVEEKWKDNNKEFSPQILGYLIHLHTLIKDHMFDAYYPDLASERRKAFSTQAYDDLALQSYEAMLELEQASFEFIGTRFEIDLQGFASLVRKIPDSERSNITADVYEYPEDDLPEVEVSVLKDAYSKYVRGWIKENQEASKNQTFANINKEYQESTARKMFINKYRLIDMIYNLYGIEVKHLNQLVKKHNLLEDSSIKDLYNQFMSSSS